PEMRGRLPAARPEILRPMRRAPVRHAAPGPGLAPGGRRAPQAAACGRRGGGGRPAGAGRAGLVAEPRRGPRRTGGRPGHPRAHRYGGNGRGGFRRDGPQPALPGRAAGGGGHEDHRRRRAGPLHGGRPGPPHPGSEGYPKRQHPAAGHPAPGHRVPDLGGAGVPPGQPDPSFGALTACDADGLQAPDDEFLQMLLRLYYRSLLTAYNSGKVEDLCFSTDLNDQSWEEAIVGGAYNGVAYAVDRCDIWFTAEGLVRGEDVVTLNAQTSWTG